MGQRMHLPVGFSTVRLRPKTPGENFNQTGGTAHAGGNRIQPHGQKHKTQGRGKTLVAMTA